MKRGRDAGKKRSAGGTGKRPARPASASKAKPAARPIQAAKPAVHPAKDGKTKTSGHAAKPGLEPGVKPAVKSGLKPAAKAVPAPRVAPAAKPGGPPGVVKGGRPARDAKGGKAAPAGKGGKTAPAPSRAVLPVVVRALPKIEAPPKFRREYRKWLERLISLRHRLLDEGNRLEEEGLKALEQEVSVDHMADYGSDSYEQDTTLALIENKTEALRDVDAAIKRIETKTYGLCEDCEQLVPHGRLEVLPHARYCVKCQAAREIPGT